MGSFAIQCNISKEPIYSGDYVYAFYLEPNNSEHLLGHMSQPLELMFQYFKVLNLPVYGKYNDYGRVDSVMSPDSTEIQFSKLAHNGYDFSEMANSNNWSATPGISKNTILFTVHKKVFESLIKEGKNLPFNIEIEQALDPKVFPHLNNEVKSSYSNNLEPFLKSISAIGYKFRVETTLVSSEVTDNGITRYNIHNSIESSIKKPNNHDHTGYLCALTGRPIKVDEPVKIAVLEPTVHFRDAISIQALRRRTVGGQFGISGPLVNGSINSNGDFVTENNDVLNMLICLHSNKEHLPTSCELINKIKKDPVFKTSKLTSYSSLMIIPNDVAIEFSGKNNNFASDYQDWKKAIKIIQKIEDISSSKSILSQFLSNGFTHHSIEDVIPDDEMLKILEASDQDRLKEVKMHMNMMITDSLLSLNSEDNYSLNEFNFLLSYRDKPISNSLSRTLKSVINATTKNKQNFDLLDKMVMELEELVVLIDGMWDSCVGIFPSNKVDKPLLIYTDKIVKAINQATKSKVSKDFKRAKKSQY